MRISTSFFSLIALLGFVYGKVEEPEKLVASLEQFVSKLGKQYDGVGEFIAKLKDDCKPEDGPSCVANAFKAEYGNRITPELISKVDAFTVEATKATEVKDIELALEATEKLLRELKESTPKVADLALIKEFESILAGARSSDEKKRKDSIALLAKTFKKLNLKSNIDIDSMADDSVSVTAA